MICNTVNYKNKLNDHSKVAFVIKILSTITNIKNTLCILHYKKSK